MSDEKRRAMMASRLGSLLQIGLGSLADRFYIKPILTISASEASFQIVALEGPSVPVLVLRIFIIDVAFHFEWCSS